MFDNLHQASRLNDNGAFPYLRTHPMTTDRIAEMQSRQQLVGHSAVAPVPDFVHAMMVARSRVLSNPGVDVLRGYVVEAGSAQTAAANQAQQISVLYSAALASAKLRDSAAATRFVAKLATLVADNPSAARIARLLAAEIALQGGDAARATTLAEGPSTARPELMLQSQAQIQGGRASDASQRLQTWVSLHPRDAQAWQLLSTAHTAQRQTLRAIRAEAEVQVAHLDYKAAMDRLRAAQDLARKAGASSAEHIEASIIDTRARQVASLLREQSLER
jgi:predicted Zn-dependent protease